MYISFRSFTVWVSLADYVIQKQTHFVNCKFGRLTAYLYENMKINKQGLAFYVQFSSLLHER